MKFASPIPIMRPKLPAAERLLPYLCKIDESRIYSNYGPLAGLLEARLAARFGVPAQAVTTVANGTLGLALSLLVQDVRPGTLCLLPAWTFVASPQAAALAGLVPYFVDVDPLTWALNPTAVTGLLADAPDEVGAVMPVMPFGQPINFAAWSHFRKRTRLPVVIDAAAGFDSLLATDVPTVVSLHATKAFGVGEGGIVVSSDTELIRGIRARANFGFAGSRESGMPALNAKLSEYHAAVGNAALDEWNDVRADWLSVGTEYQRLIQMRSERARLQPGFGQTWVSSVCVLDVGDSASTAVERALNVAGIETRRWWTYGAHLHASTLQFPRAGVPVTERLAQSTIGVPFYRDISIADIQRVVDSLASIGPGVAR